MSDAEQTYDVIVIGAGIAGASVAAFLAPHRSVLLLEMEVQPGYHTTGRSAALFTRIYGPKPIRALTRSSAAFFEQPPDGFAERPLLSPRGALMVAREDQIGSLETAYDELSAETDIPRFDGAQTQALFPLLRPGYAAASISDPGALDIDVNGLHHGFLRQFKRAGGRLLCDSPVRSIEQVAYGVAGGDVPNWLVETDAQLYRATVVINAAGAWADEIGALAGASRIGLVPKRRSVMTVAQPPQYDLAEAPVIVDIDEQFFLKPDGGQMLISPANEDPSAPCDAQPDEMDIAVCAERIERAFQFSVTRFSNKWAGLRSFVFDKSPVCGFDPRLDTFFWLAGQGGYGIQTAPALADLAASMVLGRPVPPYILDQEFDLETVLPDRLVG